MQLTATVRAKPGPGDASLTMDVITTEADDYDTAKPVLEARVPDGWQMLSVRSR